MAEEFIIKSDQIESKINQLLPSQGGFGAGVDFSASTMVIPIVDLTETAEGSSLRQDLQTSLSLTSCTAHGIQNATTTVITTTGYYRVFGCSTIKNTTAELANKWQITDGTTTKVVWACIIAGNSGGTVGYTNETYDFTVFLEAGDSLQGVASSGGNLFGSTRQIATLAGDLVNP